jgi:hypothetical protein
MKITILTNLDTVSCAPVTDEILIDYWHLQRQQAVSRHPGSATHYLKPVSCVSWSPVLRRRLPLTTTEAGRGQRGEGNELAGKAFLSARKTRGRFGRAPSSPAANAFIGRCSLQSEEDGSECPRRDLDRGLGCSWPGNARWCWPGPCYLCLVSCQASDLIGTSESVNCFF